MMISSLNFAVVSCLVFSLAQGFPKNWKIYVSKEMLDKYNGKGLTGYSASYFQGDISGIDRELSTEDLKGRLNNAISDENKRWPNGVVPFQMSEMYREDDRRVEKTLIEVAMNSIASSTGYCIKFIPRTVEEDFIYITRGIGCSSHVGRSGGRQIVSFTRGCLEEVGAIQHEFLHALGFYHENSRADRDDYVWINWKNLLPDAAKDFKIPSDAVTFGLPYDYDSIMHYRHNAFAINSSAPTIIPKEKGVGIGQSSSLSILDIVKLKRAYNCPEKEYERGIGNVYKTATVRRITAAKSKLSSPLPKWKKMHLSNAECKSLETKNCRVDEPAECSLGWLHFECNSSSTWSEIETHLLQVQQVLPFSPRGLTLEKRELKSEYLDPISENLLSLEIHHVADFSSSTFAQLRLPSLLALAFGFCRNIYIKAGTLSFNNLRLITFHESTIAEIEEGSFESLISLKSIHFDQNISPPFVSSTRDHLWRLHCSSEYRWLREYLKKHPELIEPRNKMELISVAGVESPATTRRKIYYPVDCAKEDLTGDPDQTEFSINAED